ncbi:hypothetical protein CgunFtcFv8_000904 [Champsocephalus gunnari]|uniref:Uncharacterized protein n=1 Tax=Champsocephalus gunnari TaxID=52237 RepID=A0AAN8DTM4_CHAGU|nr:hypothetical protein CgunFtcFv8_000904 [Champsocephalus gunnari]
MLTVEVEQHQPMTILHQLTELKILTLGVQASEMAWTLEPCVEEMRWVKLWEAQKINEAKKTLFDEQQSLMKEEKQRKLLLV